MKNILFISMFASPAAAFPERTMPWVLQRRQARTASDEYNMGKYENN